MVPGVPGDEQPPPYEVVAGLVASLRRELAGAGAVLEQARAELAQARERIAELEARLKQNPRNSSRPPSGEGLAKPAPRPRSLRKKSGRKPGGQDGHKGTTLAQVARPDREIRHEPGCCGHCGAGLAGRPVTAVERRQVFDLQPARAEVTEHQLIERECGCGHRTRPRPRPARKPQSSTDRGSPRSSFTCTRAAGRLDGFAGHVRGQIAASDVAGFDETGFRVEGRLAWVHCARTGKYTLLTVHAKRGRQAMVAMGILPRFAGVAVHDAWAPYDTYATFGHQLCCAHALRELQAVADAAPNGQWCWATQAAGALTAMQQPVREAVSRDRDAVDPMRWPPRSACSDRQSWPGPARPPPAPGR
jgi:transposase